MSAPQPRRQLTSPPPRSPPARRTAQESTHAMVAPALHRLVVGWSPCASFRHCVASRGVEPPSRKGELYELHTSLHSSEDVPGLHRQDHVDRRLARANPHQKGIHVQWNAQLQAAGGLPRSRPSAH
jgi:hypothetical protein